METTTTTNQTTNQTATRQGTSRAEPLLTFEESDDDFDLIEFGIASNGGRLSMKGA